MTIRIREQLERIADIKSRASLALATFPIEPPLTAGQNLEEQVEAVALSVNEMILKILGNEREKGKKPANKNARTHHAR